MEQTELCEGKLTKKEMNDAVNKKGEKMKHHLTMVLRKSSLKHFGLKSKVRFFYFSRKNF